MPKWLTAILAKPLTHNRRLDSRQRFHFALRAKLRLSLVFMRTPSMAKRAIFSVTMV